MIRDSTALYCASPIMVHEWPLWISENTYSSADCPSGKEHFTEEKNHCGSPQGMGGMSPSLLWGYSSMSFASSSEKSDIELSEEEERSSWKNMHRHYPPLLQNTKQCKQKYQKIQISRTLSVSLRASSVAYFFTYSATFFLYSSGLRWKNTKILFERSQNATCGGTWLQHPHSKDRLGLGRSATEFDQLKYFFILIPVPFGKQFSGCSD